MWNTASLTGFEVLLDHQMDLIEACCDWAFITDEAFVICHSHKCQSATEEIFPQNLIGQSFESFLPLDVRTEVMHALKTDSSMRKSGKRTGRKTIYTDPLTGLHQVKAIPVDHDGFSGYNISVRNVTAEDLGLLRQEVYGASYRTIDENAILRLQQQKLIADLALEFAKNADTDLDSMFLHLLETLGSFMGVDRCSIFRHDLEKRTYSVIYEWCASGVPSTKALLQNIPYNDDDEGFIQLTTRPYIAVDDTFQYTGEAYRVQRESGVHSFVDLPILSGGVFWGFLGADYGSGPHYWTESEFHMLQTIGGIISTALDRKEMERKLHDTLGKLVEIVNNYPGIIWAVDNNNVVNFFEGRGIAHLGIQKDALLGACLNDPPDFIFTSDPSGGNFLRHNETLTKGDQSYYININGRHFTCETTLLHTIDGEASGVVGVALDVTDMHEMQEQLKGAMEQAEKASQAKSEFLSRTSHEIRTPMNAIIGMTEIAKHTSDLQRVQYCLSKIDQASHQLLDIINDILDLSKIESGKMDIMAVEFDFEKMLQNTYTIIQSRIEEAGLEFAFDLGAHCARYVISDELRLTQVITNLLSNAVKFTPNGGKITLHSRFLEETADRALLRVEVRDTGIGISPGDQKRLFQSFEQADGSITRRFGGTGLGLSICKNILQLMEGAIWVESQPGQGSRFIFEVEVALGGPCMTAAATTPVSSMREIRLLVADKSEDALSRFRQICDSFHMHCDVAHSAKEALDLLDQDGPRYNVVFLAYDMPDMNGIETAKAMAGRIFPAHIVLMFTGSDWKLQQAQGEEMGLAHFISKPLLPSTIYNAIAAITTGRVQSQARRPSAAEVPRWEGKTILVAEDIEINQVILRSLLEKTGVTIVCANDGKQALSLFGSHPDRYDLILMDVQMPEMDGYEATRKLRSSGWENADTIPIFAMTANAFSEDVERCLAAGMNSHIAKPINVTELMEKLRTILSPKDC